ncbi:MAG TPA: tRNA (adenosine(37)-N6)-threonylcarbamoyltransferase complex transferase subunit TsaD [Candidatus Paceibacterota bacterium]|jgi:N6-L-threonylcarbamoyladenine synthase|nr:tRNA (adenosine(37)-N6)-threonylcarbamoyltransferase complex transferase subunit TsaD [Candidatus Paceibacterota bacterium]
MIILGIETSCDETALALIETREIKSSDGKVHTEYRIIQSLVHSQAELHSAYGGVFPTLAKREHSKNLVPLLEKILKDLPSDTHKKHPNFTETLESFKQAYCEQNADLLESFTHARFLEHIPHIDRIAVTEGPGLEPALWVGIIFARMLGELWNIPVIPVNHMEGHVVGSLLDNDKPSGAWQQLKKLEVPAVALLISGGHTELVEVTRHKLQLSYSLLGQTRDDAVGEAFDKTARLLGLQYPGGPHISRLAHEAGEEKIISSVKLPRPMISSNDLNFSFSGLKTAVLYAVQDAQKNNTFNETFKKGLAREFEQSITEVLVTKLQKAIEETGAQSIIIGGGVSANHVLRAHFAQIAERYSIPLFLPSMHISGDNALMIALVGSMKSETTAQSTPIHAHGTKKITE